MVDDGFPTDRDGSGWGSESVIIHVASIGFLVIGSFWTMVSFVWMLGFILTRAGDRREFIVYVSFWSLFFGPTAGLLVLWLGWYCAGFAGSLWLAPILGTLEMIPPPEAAPFYSRAIANIQFGKYADAEAAVIRELEKCENDFNGWMMLAELYATHFHDLAGADCTVRETCDQPNAKISDICAAFHRLADWHLKFGENPGAARRSLEEICQRYPATHLDRMARMRIDQLPANRDELIELRKPRIFRLPALSIATHPSDANGDVATIREDPV
ncbi:MAG: hypothetical protein ABIV39_02585, partial [Verrucomicrobiota bacterium]